MDSNLNMKGNRKVTNLNATRRAGYYIGTSVSYWVPRLTLFKDTDFTQKSVFID